MTKDEFAELGFTHEVLPSGHINIINTVPFLYNNTKTICCYGGKYSRTTTHKDLALVLSNLFELKTIERASLNSKTVSKENTKEARQTRQAVESPQQNQQVTEPISTKKRRRTKKTKATPEQIVSE